MPIRNRLLDRILRQSGAYYHSAELFYQELWRQRLLNLGFRVVSVKKLPHHDVWDLRVFNNLATQLHLLSRPGAKTPWAGDMLPKLVAREVQRIAAEMGPPIPKDRLHVTRSGAYFRMIFLWPPGKPGSWFKREKPAEAFSFLIKPWVHKCRN